MRAKLRLKILDAPPSQKVLAGGYADIAAGFGGVLVRPDFFDDDAFDIPPSMFSTDDHWLSGYLTLKGIPIWITKEVGFPYSDRHFAHPAGYVTPLNRGCFDGRNQFDVCVEAVEYFRERYGIW